MARPLRSRPGFEYLNPRQEGNDTHLFYWWNGRNLLEWVHFIFLGDAHCRAHSAFTGLAQIQLHLTTIKEALAQYVAFLLTIYGSIYAEPAAITSLNSVKVTVASGACGCDFQSIQCREVEAIRLVVRSADIFALAEASTPRESCGLVDIWSDPLMEKLRNKQGYTSRTVAWCSAGLHQACALRLLA